MRSLSASQYDFSTPYEFAPRPDWVEPRTPPEDFAHGEGVPNSYSLIDLQLLARDDKNTFYRRLTQHIADASCIEDASQFLYETVPGSEMVVFHSCTLIRNGKHIDALDQDNIRCMQREKQLESHVSTNRITIELTIDDLRVGDIVDIEVSELEIKGEHPLYGHFLRWMSWLSWNVPVALQSVRVTNKSSTSLSIHQLDSSTELSERVQVPSGENFEKRWTGISVGQFGSRTPDNYWPHCLFITSAFSWSDVSGYLHKYYQANGALDDAPVEIDESEALDFSAKSTESIVNIIRFVQENIRYRSDSSGIFSHTPKLPSLTLKKRAGDCKDKSNLLVALLKKAGLNAALALVNTSLNDAIRDLDPSPYLFNHMIVWFEWQGKPYFVDATSQKQGGTLEQMIPPNFKTALILSAQGNDLVAIERQRDALELVVSHHFDFSEADKSSASVQIKREYRGARADNMRFYLASQNTESLQQHYHDSTSNDLGVKLSVISPYKIDSDDRSANVLMVSEHYQFAADDEGLHEGRISVTTSFLGDLTLPATEKHPVDLSNSGKTQHNINILYARAPDFTETDSFSKKNKWFSFTDTTEIKGHQLHFNIELEPHSNLISTDELDAYRNDAEAVYQRSGTTFPVLIQDNSVMIKSMFTIAAVLAIAVVLVNSVL